MAGNLVLLLGVFAVINIFAFVWVGMDKKRSLNRVERFPEVSFFLISIFFASLGVLLGMFVFRHKTKKIYFPVGVCVLLLQQVLLVFLLFQQYSIRAF